MGPQLARAKIDGISLFLFYTGRDRQEKKWAECLLCWKDVSAFNNQLEFL